MDEKEKISGQRSLLRRSIVAALNEEESILLVDVYEECVNVIFTDGERFGIRITDHPHVDAAVREERRTYFPPAIGAPYGSEPWADQ